MRTSILSSLACFGVTALFLVGLVPGVHAGVQVIASAGDASPDGNGLLDIFGVPILSDTGSVAFYAQLSGTSGGSADNLALFTGDTTQLDAIARRGVTQLDGSTISSFNILELYIDDTGSVSSLAQVDGGFLNFIGDESLVRPLVLPSSASPSGNNELVFNGTPALGPNGSTAYRATYSGENAESGVYLQTPAGVASIVALAGDSAPGGGVLDLQFNTSPPLINAGSQVAFLASVDDTIDYNAILRYSDGVGAELARSGGTTTDGQITFDFLTSLSPLSNSGAVAFAAQYSEGTAQRQGVFLADGANITLQAGGILPGASIPADEIQMIGLNEAGQSAFLAEVEFSRFGIYRADDEQVVSVAQEETLTPRGDKFFLPFNGTTVALSEAGDVIFSARLADEPDALPDSFGIFRYSDAAGLEQLLTMGDPLLGSTLTGIGFTGQGQFLSQAGSLARSSVNSAGEFAFLFALEDGRDGIAIWTLDDEPEILPGDFNGDGQVDAIDYALWRENLGDFDESALGGAGDGEGGVDSGDFDLWLANYGASLPQVGETSAAPEPACWLLVALGAIAMAGFGPRRAASKVAGVEPHRAAGTGRCAV